MDRNILTKENEKVEKYLDLSIKLQHLWNTNVQVIPLIFGALWSMSNSIYTYLATLQVAEIGVHQLQNTVVLRTANIIRRHIILLVQVELENLLISIFVLIYGANE